MHKNIKYSQQLPDIDKYYSLYLETGWDDYLSVSKNEIAKSLRQSFTCISAYAADELIGFGRVVSDGVIYAAVYDVIVKKKYKNKGIGKEIVKMLLAECKKFNIRSIHLFAAKGTQEFYEKIGFVTRTADAPGMKYEK